MFGKKDAKLQSAENISEANLKSQTLPKGYNPPKGGATPKRKTVEARNKRPLIASTANLSKAEKKERKLEARRRSNELYQKQQEALRTGDEQHMPYQYRGKVRRWGRDYIDATGPLAAWFMPFAIMILPLVMVQGYFPHTAMYLTIILYLVFGIMAAHAIYLANRAKKLARKIFGDDQIPRGYAFQLFARCFYPRRWRLPKPMVARGEFPHGVKTKNEIN